MTFIFESNNPQGTNPVTKMVAYVPMMRYGKEYYNLEFGDFNYTLDAPNYWNITDNGDMRKVLKTVASTIELFFDESPDKKVHFDGSDERRHLYYHKLIRDYRKFIDPLYKIEGYLAGKLERFRVDIEYDFIVVSKPKSSRKHS